MSLTPIKTAQIGLRIIKTTPKLSRKFLSPSVLTPRACARKLYFSPNGKDIINSNNSVEIFINDVRNTQNEAFLINTPNKLSLLSRGVEKLSSVIGKGSFGTVIKATYKERKVAAKIVKTERISSEKNALLLNHENIVKTIEMISDSTKVYSIILMELQKTSKELQNVLDDEKFEISKDLMIKFALDITKGLKHCHENNILHLDIKPRNILVCHGKICKICDFGNSLMIGDNVKRSFPFQGTVAYTAPEIFKGELFSKKTDLYSMGILLWQLRYRVLPYAGLNNEIIIYKVVKFGLRPPDNTSFKEKVDGFSKLYYSCWQETPEKRPTASEAIRILEEL